MYRSSRTRKARATSSREFGGYPYAYSGIFVADIYFRPYASFLRCPRSDVTVAARDGSCFSAPSRHPSGTVS